MSKKTKIPSPDAPRALTDIQNEYGRLTQQAGHLQYEIGVRQEQLADMNKQLKAVQMEAAARNELDKQVAAETKEATSEPVQA